MKAGRIQLDEHGRPNIIGNAEDQDFDDDQVQWSLLPHSSHL